MDTAGTCAVDCVMQNAVCRQICGVQTCMNRTKEWVDGWIGVYIFRGRGGELTLEDLLHLMLL